ncbi:MAG: TonB-dependent receptor [Spirosomataceae bacterium]
MRFLILFILLSSTVTAQTLRGVVKDIQTREPVAFAAIGLVDSPQGVVADSAGQFTLVINKTLPVTIQVTAVGYAKKTWRWTDKNQTQVQEIYLEPASLGLAEVVVTGTMKEVRKDESPIPVDIFAPKFFQRNASSNLVENLSFINGITPQVTCNVCNTSSLSINGIEGPYTMILIDGMPIVSGLATVYGLTGIPNSMIERIEVSKGPASTLYGSEAVAGVINVITKRADKSPRFSIDHFSTTEGEHNTDISTTFRVQKASSLVGINHYAYNRIRDINGDNFTDMSLQNRFSIFNKWNFERQNNRVASLAARYVYEDRWGGELNWTPEFRGGDQIYGESIYTSRMELLGRYQLPFATQKVFWEVSFNDHDQNSVYGNSVYLGRQRVLFSQLYWDKKLGAKHDALIGMAYRRTWYDDNTPATLSVNGEMNTPSIIHLPGIYFQNEWSITDHHKLLMGARYDYNTNHGNVWTPRLSYKFSKNPLQIFRLTLGNGFRVVNLFTEDHASLISAREVVIKNELNPERSYNINANYVWKLPVRSSLLSLDGSLFYTYFTNQILPDYSDPEKIIYDNLNGHAVTRGASLNVDWDFPSGWDVMAGITWIDTYKKEPNEFGIQEKTPQILASRFSGTFSVSYTWAKPNLTLDWIGSVRGPMYMPVFPNDSRPELSPWYSLQNIQVTKRFKSKFELYGGVKNLLNFVPTEEVILRAFDPFDRMIDVNNPNNFTFDPTYSYAPIQGRKFQLGVRLTM